MDDTDIDPAMMEAMGFTTFGSKPQKKRKLNAAEAFIDPTVTEAQAHAPATGANALSTTVKSAPGNTKTGEPLAERPADSSAGTSSKQIPARPHHTPGSDQSLLSFASNIDADDSESLQALKNGVQNQFGDMVYFLPDFLEDPWSKLRK